MAQDSSDLDELREEIDLQEGFLKSLEDEPDADSERERIAATLTELRLQLDKMQPQSQPRSLPWGDSSYQSPNIRVEDPRPGSSNSSAFSNRSYSANDQPQSYLSHVQDLPNRKRYRNDDDLNPPVAKSRRSTPQPRTASRATSIDDLDFFDAFSLQNVLGDDWQEQERENKDYWKSIETRKRQEEEDAAFARQLQERWDQDLQIQQPLTKTPKPSYAHSSSSLNQSYMKPDGSWQKPLSQPQSSRVKTEHGLDNVSMGTMTPLTDSSGGLEEISYNDWQTNFGENSTLLNSEPNAQELSSAPLMPGTFPTTQYSPYAGAPGSSVYGGSYTPYSNRYGSALSAQPVHTPYGRSYSSIPGSVNLPFDLDSMPTPPYRPSPNEYANPAQDQEDIKDLLKHIRPDEELTEEQLHEVQPESLRINLLPHQRKGYAWLKGMEEGTNKGGILADDMGLGKTVQALALILGRPPEPNARTPTLVVAPVALMQQWEREIQKFVKPQHALNVLILHGENRNKPWNFIRDYDVVLTTYGTLASDLKRRLFWNDHLLAYPDARPKAHQECPILGSRSKFHRVILDEAQNIKNKNTKAAVAACKIDATYRWCLSGTPMQNNVDEIYSLIKFCRIRPYHDYERFARDIGRPLRRNSDWGKDTAMKRLQTILKAILLRRTKDSKIDGQPILSLPEKHTVEDRAVFSKDELEFYQQLEKNAQIQFNRYLEQGTVGRYYSHALVLLLRLRQCCCSPQLVTNAKEFLTSGSLDGVDHVENARNLSKDVIRRLDENDAFECPICMDAVENPIIFPCGHALCNECLGAMVDKAMTDTQAKITCPHCRADVDTKKVTDLESYLRVYHPDRPGVQPLDEDDDEEESDSDSLDSSDDEAEKNENEDDDGSDLKDFIVPDDEVENKSDDDDDDDDFDEFDLKARLQKVKGEEDEDEKKLVVVKKSDEKLTKKSKKDKIKRKAKGKGKAKATNVSLADLRKEGLKNKAAKKRYLKRLEKSFKSSAKIERTVNLLHEIRDRALGEKTIVFSSFTSFLDLLEVPLHRDDELSNYARYDGSMKAADRNNAVIRFTDDPHCKVMLVSLKAGNSGLNLTAANHVILLDPFWNPFVEYQAADRCYRIGQEREVTIHRVLIGQTESINPAGTNEEENDFTVEDRILRLQDKKRKLVEMALDEKAASSLGRLTTRDLGYLFGVNSLN